MVVQPASGVLDNPLCSCHTLFENAEAGFGRRQASPELCQFWIGNGLRIQFPGIFSVEKLAAGLDPRPVAVGARVVVRHNANAIGCRVFVEVTAKETPVRRKTGGGHGSGRELVVFFIYLFILSSHRPPPQPHFVVPLLCSAGDREYQVSFTSSTKSYNRWNCSAWKLAVRRAFSTTTRSSRVCVFSSCARAKSPIIMQNSSTATTAVASILQRRVGKLNSFFFFIFHRWIWIRREALRLRGLDSGQVLVRDCELAAIVADFKSASVAFDALLYRTRSGGPPRDNSGRPFSHLSRHNFPNYNFVWHCLFMRRGRGLRRDVQAHFFFPLLRTETVLRTIHSMWQLICSFCHWDCPPLEHILDRNYRFG